MSQARNWCFTLNNPNEADFFLLRRLFDHEDPKSRPRYGVFQQEIGKEGTPHIQGYLSFPSLKRLNQLKKLVSDRAHFEVAKGTPQQNRDYCSKSETAVPGTLEEFGSLPAPKGSRSDLDDFKEAVRNGLKRSVALEEHSEVMAKYPRFAREYMDLHKSLVPVPDHDLRPWQTHLEELLTAPPNDREIIFVVDKKGNQGKTWFAKRFCQRTPTAQYMEPGKKADMAYLISEETTHLFVNVTRQQVEHLQYSFLEAVKDGLVFSPKYESGMKYLKPMHVIVLMNQEPDLALLSEDRYNIINLN